MITCMPIDFKHNYLKAFGSQIKHDFSLKEDEVNLSILATKLGPQRLMVKGF